MATRHTCVTFAAVGATLGLAAVAWAQEPNPAAQAALDPASLALVELLKGGGLPAVLAAIAWWLGRTAHQGLMLTVRLHDDDRRLLEDLRRNREER